MLFPRLRYFLSKDDEHPHFYFLFDKRLVVEPVTTYIQFSSFLRRRERIYTSLSYTLEKISVNVVRREKRVFVLFVVVFVVFVVA